MYNRHIYTFIQVADSGSFSKAAEILFISTVSVMKQINALETDIGVKLLQRTNQGVFLTAAGRSIYQDAKQMIQASDSAIQRARQIAGEEQNKNSPIVKNIFSKS
ncbi:LysR family transcriptional regulator [Neobacillus vireti]|uniref:LysR family transcriptional regulator n=1 Tax=Neobacillus vireti TaxID=220686 RepID=UPI002FFF6583